MEKYFNLTSTDNTFSFSADAQVTNVEFDPQGWLLARFSMVNVSFVQYQRPIFEEPIFWISAIVAMILVIALIILVRRRRGCRELSQKP
jgi:dolichyl-phosphate-mannose--protein O-mannosyl transferase